MGRFGLVFRHSLTVAVEHAQVVLRLHDSLIGGFPVPLGGLREILRHALSASVQKTQIVLRMGSALFGKGLPFFQSGGIVPGVISFESRLKIRSGGKNNKQQKKQPARVVAHTLQAHAVVYRN